MIKKLMQKGVLENPYLLIESDLGRWIDTDFGRVLRADIGKKLHLNTNGLIYMESIQQQKERIKK